MESYTFHKNPNRLKDANIESQKHIYTHKTVLNMQTHNLKNTYTPIKTVLLIYISKSKKRLKMKMSESKKENG